MNAVDVSWVGLEIIERSALGKGSKRRYSSRWRSWTRWCSEADVGLLSATCDDVLSWLDAAARTPHEVVSMRKAGNFVYQALGVGSPFRERRVLAAVKGELSADWTGDGYCEAVQKAHSRRVRDYLVWCEQAGRAPFPGGGEQVAAFLLWMSESFNLSEIATASAGVSRYLESNGYPGTSHHPAVQSAMKDCKTRLQAGGGPGKTTSALQEVRRRGSIPA